MAVSVATYEFLRFGIRKIPDSLLSPEVELDPEPPVFRIEEAVGMASEAVHVAIRGRNAAITHNHGDLMKSLGQKCPEIPVVRSAVHVGAGVALHYMIQVREFERITQEKHGRIVAHQVPVALIRIELDGKTTNISFGIRRTALAGHGGETDEHFRFLADFCKKRGLRVHCDVVCYRERSVRTGPFGVHASFRNDFTVEMCQLLLKPDILHQHGTTRTGRQNMIVVGYGRTGAGRQKVACISHMLSPLVCAPESAFETIPKLPSEENMTRQSVFVNSKDYHYYLT